MSNISFRSRRLIWKELKQLRYDNDKVTNKMIIRPNADCFEIFSNSTHQSLVKSVEKGKSSDGETVVQDSAILGSKRYKLNIGSRTHLEAILQRYGRHFKTKWLEFLALTIQCIAPCFLSLGAVERAFGWYDLFISGRHVSSLPDRILLGTFSAKLADGAYMIS
jgi:hypothetical protein